MIILFKPIIIDESNGELCVFAIRVKDSHVAATNKAWFRRNSANSCGSNNAETEVVKLHVSSIEVIK
jgi:hypothetical protein